VQTMRDNFANRNVGLAVRDQMRLHLYMGANGDGSGAVQHTDAIAFNPVSGSWNDLYDYKSAHLAAARVGIFHYALFAHDRTGGGAGGEAEPYGDDVAIYHVHTTNAVQVVATWMQELGHNILGMHFTLCGTGGGDWRHNPSATHLNFHDFEGANYNAFFDQGRNSDGLCGTRDQVQDVFAHASTTDDAMGYSYVTGNAATSYSTATWNALRPGEALDARRDGNDIDAGIGPEFQHDHEDGVPLDDLFTLVTPLVPNPVTPNL